jgi:DNA recombination protein RmuC
LWLYSERQRKSLLKSQKTEAGFARQLADERLAAAERVVAGIREQCSQLLKERDANRTLQDDLKEKEARLRSEVASLQSRLEQERLRSDEKLDLLKDAREELRLQFSELASTVLEEKSRHFSKESGEKLSLLLGPFHEELSSFRERVDSIHHDETRDRAALQREIKALRSINLQMNDETIKLSRALKGDKRVQGTWGEMVLERVLEQSALRKGIEYETQVVLRDTERRLQRPDVIVHLPEGRDIIIDSKVSFVAWEQYVNCEDEDLRGSHLASHVKAIRQHVKLLGDKDYSSLPQLQSLDFVLMFMPIEAAFLAAFQADDSLFASAMGSKVILVGPTTLLSTLRTIESIWHYQQQSRNAREIAERAAALYDKFCSFTEDMERMGKQIHGLENSYESAMIRLSQGRGNLISRVQRFPQMGVKVKKAIPASVLKRCDIEHDRATVISNFDGGEAIE